MALTAANGTTDWAKLCLTPVWVPLVILLALLGTLLPSALEPVAALLVAHFVETNSASAAQDSCAVYIVGVTSRRGKPMDQIRAHIADALAGGSPNFVTYKGPGDEYSREWLRVYRAPSECDQEAVDAFSGATGEQPSCDEDPFATVFEGGQAGDGLAFDSPGLQLIWISEAIGTRRTLH